MYKSRRITNKNCSRTRVRNTSQTGHINHPRTRPEKIVTTGRNVIPEKVVNLNFYNAEKPPLTSKTSKKIMRRKISMEKKSQSCQRGDHRRTTIETTNYITD
jgi:hypothetical protein